MDIGTIEPITDPPRKGKRPRRMSGGPGQYPGGRGGDNGGGDGPDQQPGPAWSDERGSGVPDKSRVVTWFLLLVVMMTFGGLIGAYVVVATNGQSEWVPFDLPFQVWISTAILIASSAAYHFAQSAIFGGDNDRVRKWLVTTTVLGAAFISSQLILWLALVSRGLYMTGNPYAGFFYILTGVHALHILGGIIALGAIMIRSWHPAQNEHEQKYRCDLARGVGWYWHFMGVVWIVLALLLGVWK